MTGLATGSPVKESSLCYGNKKVNIGTLLPEMKRSIFNPLPESESEKQKAYPPVEQHIHCSSNFLAQKWELPSGQHGEKV